MTPLAEAPAQCSGHADVLRGAIDNLPPIDVLNRLERFGDLSTADWLRWRALRNPLTHEYPDKPQIRAAVLDHALVAAVAMTGLLEGIREHAARR
jgi:hypothetical protein